MYVNFRKFLLILVFNGKVCHILSLLVDQQVIFGHGFEFTITVCIV